MKMELFCWKTRWKSDWRNSQNEKLLTKHSEQDRLVGTAEQTFSNGISGSWSWNGPYFYNFKDSKDASKFWVGFSRMPSHVISIAMGVLCRSQWELYFQGASKNHRLITTCWNRPQEVSGPNSCSDQRQLWDQMRLLQALSWWVLEVSKDTDCILPEHPFAVLDSSFGVPRCFGKTSPKSLIMLHKFLAGCSSAVAKGQQQNG